MKYFDPLPPEVEEAATATVDAAYKMHRTLGPGLLESVYELCLAHELRKRALNVRTQLNLPITYEDITIDSGLRLDMLIADVLVVEVKAVEKMHPIHQAQLFDLSQIDGEEIGFID
jgi:GxxExxY protein